MKINNFTELYQNACTPRAFTSAFITGHLVVEFLLRKLIQIYDPKLSAFSDDLNYSKLVDLNYDIGTITEVQKKVLKRINSIRNKFAHNLTYEPSITELKSLFKEASNAFNDLTDGISQGLELLESETIDSDLEDWGIAELFIQISYDLHEEYQSRGGDIENF